MEPKINKAVHAAAMRYARRRDERIAANKEEKDAHNSLLNTMKEEGLTSYSYQDVEIHIDSQEKCKVKIQSMAPVEGDAE